MDLHVEKGIIKRGNNKEGARQERGTQDKNKQGADEGEKENKGRRSCESKATCV